MAQGKNVRINDTTSKIYISAMELATLGESTLEDKTTTTVDGQGYSITSAGRHWMLLDGKPDNTFVNVTSVN